MRRRAWWTVLVVAVVLVGAALWGGLGLGVQSLRGAGPGNLVLRKCLPATFPVPDGARVSSLTANLNSGGSTRQCQAEFDVESPRDRVYQLYLTRLPAAGWPVVSADSESGHIAFQRSQPKAAAGTVDVTSGPRSTAHVKVAVSGDW